jgi:hypothetical protein
MDLSRFDRDDDFSAREVACLMIGNDPHTETSDVRIAADLKRILEAYYSAFRHVETVTPERVEIKYPPSYLFSLDMKQWWGTKLHIFGCYPEQKRIPSESEIPLCLKEFAEGFPSWNRHLREDFASQRFARADIHSWLTYKNFKSSYLFVTQSEMGDKVPHKEETKNSTLVHINDQDHDHPMNDPIAKARGECEKPNSAAAVMVRLKILANGKYPPLIKPTLDGVVYEYSGLEKVYTRNALQKHLKRRKK